MPSHKLNDAITLYGSKADIYTAIGLLEHFPVTINEGSDRTILQGMIDNHNIKARILYKGNSVYGLDKLLHAFRRCVKAGGPSYYFTKDLYNFLHLNCGTIAHYNQAGWVAKYPLNSNLRSLFNRNEYGQPVIAHIPRWKTDAVRIARAFQIELGA